MAENEFEKEEQWRKAAKEYFFKFWRHWDAWVISVLGGSLCLILVLRGILTGISERVMWIVIVVGVIRAGFKIWRDLNRAHESSVTAYANEIARLNAKIGELQIEKETHEDRLKERSDKQIRKVVITQCLSKMQERKDAIAKIPFELFLGQKNIQMELTRADIETIYQTLSKGGYGDAAALFKSSATIKAPQTQWRNMHEVTSYHRQINLDLLDEHIQSLRTILQNENGR